jgi:hypothetical protein
MGNSRLHFGFDDFRSDYLGEYEAICETALARESGPWMGLIDENKPRVENLVQLSLHWVPIRHQRQMNYSMYCPIL